MKQYLLLLVLFCLPAFAQESCTLASDGTTLTVSDCSPTLDAAPFTATVSFTPAYSYADNRYCLPGNVAGFGISDGPATLPQACTYTALASTPSPGALTKVAAGNLQTALDAAQCGDTLLLDHAATFSASRFTLPNKLCDDHHWITVRTDSPDSALPYEGKRIDPSFASLLPKLMLKPGAAAFSCQAGANHYRLLGLNFVKGSGGTLNAFFDTAGCTKLVIDRTLWSGNAGEELCHGINLHNSTYVAVIDSDFREFHGMTGTGHVSCDAQAVVGGNGTTAMGPYKIVNNYLEAATENVMFGGGATTQVPADIEIRRNDLNKPMSWMQAQPDGSHYVVKNLFELKSAARVLFEDNHLSNVWGGYSQTGAAILLTAKNQANLAPAAAVHDVTLRNSTISHACMAMQIAFATSDAGGYAAAEYNLSLHDLSFSDLLASDLTGCAGYLNGISTGPLNPNVMHDLALYNISESLATTHLPLAGFSFLGGSNTNKMYNVSWLNSTFPAGQYGITSTGAQATSNCATLALGSGGPKAKLDGCFNNYQFTGNTIPGGNLLKYPIWPAGNVLP